MISISANFHSRARHLITVVLFTGALACLTSCSGPAKLAKKAAWFTITTTGKLAFKTVAIGAHVAYKGVSAGADLLTSRADRKEAVKVAHTMMPLFWMLLGQEKYEAAYRMFSPQLRSMLAERDFERQTVALARNIKRYKVREPRVKERSVEVPTDVKIEKDGQQAKVRATASLVRLDHEWFIDGWEIKDGAKLSGLKDLDQPETGDDTSATANSVAP